MMTRRDYNLLADIVVRCAVSFRADIGPRETAVVVENMVYYLGLSYSNFDADKFRTSIEAKLSMLGMRV